MHLCALCSVHARCRCSCRCRRRQHRRCRLCVVNNNKMLNTIRSAQLQGSSGRIVYVIYAEHIEYYRLYTNAV